MLCTMPFMAALLVMLMQEDERRCELNFEFIIKHR